MRLLTPILLAGILVVGPGAGHASAVTIADLLNLKANGLSDQVLIALIESDGSVFRLSADEVVDLRKKGLSETVLIAMLLTAKGTVRNPVAEAEPLAAEGSDEAVREDRAIRTSPPTTVNVHQTVIQKVESSRETQTVYVPVPVAVPASVAPAKPRAEPVYWGYGGKRRGDSWDEAPDEKPTKPALTSDTTGATGSTVKANTATSSAATVKGKGGV